MTVLMYLYSRLHMHRTVHGKLKVSILFGKGNRGWKFLRAGLNPYCLGLGGLKRLNLVSENREFNSLEWDRVQPFLCTARRSMSKRTWTNSMLNDNFSEIAFLVSPSLQALWVTFFYLLKLKPWPQSSYFVALNLKLGLQQTPLWLRTWNFASAALTSKSETQPQTLKKS